MKHYTYPDWVSPHADHWRQWLAPFAGLPVRAVEIGSFEGRSACWFLDNILTNERAALVCIDPWERDWYGANWPADAETNFDHNTAEYGRRCIKARGTSFTHLCLSAAQYAPLAFAYVDGDHHGHNLARDALMLWELLQPGGLLILDDYAWTNPAVRCPPGPAIDALIQILPHAGHVNGRQPEHAANQIVIWKPQQASGRA